MRVSITTAALCLAAASLLALPAESAWAAKRKTTEAGTVHKTHKAKRTRSSGDESAKERERRLLRECKGLPNAGACLGYAS